MLTVQELIRTLQEFWVAQGCTGHLGHDVETGAGTFNPATFFRCLGPEPYRAAYVELSRRPKDGRYAENPNRMQLFHQYQVIIKPSPHNIQDLYLQSLEAIGFQLKNHDIRFVHDDWEQPTLGAWGLGWEVWRDGMEVTQFTYFQAVANIELHPITVELTYGIERLAMVVQEVDSVWDLKWSDTLTYTDVFHANEVEWCRYNFEASDPKMLANHFEDYAKEAQRLAELDLAMPAYDFVMKASHAFNTLDARGVISVTERQGYITRIRDLARAVAESYMTSREKLGAPLIGRPWPVTKRPEVKPEPLPKGGDPSKREDFLLEIGSEELPAVFVPIGCANLKRDLTKLLEEHGLVFDSIEIRGAPRRLAATVKGLALGKASEKKERRGPPVAAAYDADEKPTKVGEGFLRSIGDAPVEKRELKGKEYLFATIETPAVSTAEILSDALPKLIYNLDFPKKMRWGDLNVTYARPLQWIVALHGKQVIPFALGDIHSGRESEGHRQLCPGRFTIKSPEAYVETLRKHKVLVDIDERKEEILLQLANIEKEASLQALELETVLPQVLDLVEWPLLTTAPFDEKFLRVPGEVLISEMVHHQKYFPLADSSGKLANQFVITADNTPSDEIRNGNTKVLSARLADGVFLYEQDLKTPLDTFVEKLKAVTYRKELGSVYHKTERIIANVERLHHHLPLGDRETAKRAAFLCKADLASGLVDEFPDLQGVVGRYYAAAQGESAAVAEAIDEHWMPRGEKAPLPGTPASILVSMSDKIDNLISCFALGLKPTSSSDPYALRRAALGIIKMLVTGEHHLDLPAVLSECYADFLKQTGLKEDSVVDEIIGFFRGRIKTVFQEWGLSKEETEAALTGELSDIYDAFCRAKALKTFRETSPEYPKLAEVYKRAKGILEKEPQGAVEEGLLQEAAEKALYRALEGVKSSFEQALSERRYDEAYALVAQLQAPLSTLFDEVRVNAEDPALKANRLALVGGIFALFARLLDFSKII